MEENKHSVKSIGIGISTQLFYGKNKLLNPSRNIIKKKSVLPPHHSSKFRKIMGPSTTWKIFKKQKDVLDFVSSNNNLGLMPFTFQSNNNGVRLFLAAHPETLWYYIQQFDKSHTYEIIREHIPCKLYFDIEYDKDVNTNLDDMEGIRLVDVFVRLVCHALKNVYYLNIKKEEILILDSTTNSKFSQHVIFNITNHIFKDNYHVGNFVKKLCQEIETKSNLVLLKGVAEIDENLVVKNSKGDTKLICDESVYSKNRHFRLYKSSKHSKNIPLIIAKNNNFVSKDEDSFFLSCLLTFIPNLKKYTILEYDDFVTKNEFKSNLPKLNMNIKYTIKSSYPDLDEFIKELSYPGYIYRINEQDNNTIIYDIVNNRFCSNINRRHKSNNIKFVVDISDLTYHQECYDFECKGYKSPKIKLPINLNFLLNDDTILFNNDEDVNEILECSDINFDDIF